MGAPYIPPTRGSDGRDGEARFREVRRSGDLSQARLQTVLRAEIWAICHAAAAAAEGSTIYSDNQSAVAGASATVAGRPPKSNRDLWRIYARVVQPDVEVAWVPAHLDEAKAAKAGLSPKHRLGNARADELATRGIREHGLDPGGGSVDPAGVHGSGRQGPRRSESGPPERRVWTTQTTRAGPGRVGGPLLHPGWPADEVHSVQPHQAPRGHGPRVEGDALRVQGQTAPR